MKKIISYLPHATAYFFVLLFCYAAVSKMLDFENFQVQISQSPLLSAYAGFVSYAVIAAELVIAGLLLWDRTRLAGLYASFTLMVAFTVYIYLILNFSDFVPCSCGGILEKMGWTEHLIFNIGCVVLAAAGALVLEKDQSAGVRRPLLKMAVMFLVGSGGMVALFLSSEHIIKKENNFTRRFLLHPAVSDRSFDLKLNSYYFAGADQDRIYLGNVTAPLVLTTVDTAMTASQQMRISLDQRNHQFRDLRLQVKAPFYYLSDGSVPVIYRGTLGHPNASTVSFRDAFFTQLAAVDSMRFALRTQQRKTQQYILAGLDLWASPKLRLYPGILEKQQDGVFDVDGRLIRNHTTNQLIYIYTYRNGFTVMDSHMKVLKKLRTIDTTAYAQIVTKVLSDGTHRMTAPPLKVNVNMTANRTVFFNQSNLMGRHESSSAWKKSAVVDLYHTSTGEYLGSFYVRNRDDTRMSAMLATDRYLYVLIGQEMIRYRLGTAITKHYKTGEAENLKPE